MSTPTTSPGGTGEVQVDVENLDAYLREVLIPLSERAHAVANKFTSVPTWETLFGPTEKALELARHHKWGHDVYGPTLSALANDVDTLIEKLGKVIQTYRDHDDQVGLALAKLGANLSGDGGYTSAATFSQETAAHGGVPTVSRPAMPTSPGMPAATVTMPDTLPDVAAAQAPAEPAATETAAAEEPAAAEASAAPEPPATTQPARADAPASTGQSGF